MKQRKRVFTFEKLQPVDLTDQQVRLELNEAKWVAIWAPTHSKVKVKGGRRIERKLNDTDIQAITVYYVPDIGTLTTDDLRTYLALILIWEKNGRPTDKPVPFSLAQLARAMGITWRAKTGVQLRCSLNRLGIVPMKWENCFYHKPSDQFLTVIMPRHILSYLTFGEKREKGKKVADQDHGAFKFDPHVLDNLMANYSKPIYIDDALALNNELAILLFMHLDIVMADKKLYERNSAELFRELGLQDQKKYQYLSGRQQALQPALKELLGKRLSTGVIRKIDLITNINGDDHKLTVRKGSFQELVIEAAPLRDKKQKSSPSPTAIPPTVNETPFTDEQQKLFAQLQKEFLVAPATAATLVTQHLEATRHQLAAWSYRDHSQIQEKASWIIRAIERAYELPQDYLDALKKREQEEQSKRSKAAIVACGFCDETGKRLINDNGKRCIKRCSHDPAIESILPNYY